ncbi:hypothetical protein [Pseudomonas sp. B22129]|jgi:hypothetical protein|uniref:hypothetical protein n=1 Tax=Pseudomonas sp. B22129 TaxID=3235111 RepID=UPI003783F9D1
MSCLKALISPLVFIAQVVGLWEGNYCYGASSLERPIVRGYEGNGGVTVELVMSGSPGKEWALLRIRGTETEAGAVVHQASVQRSPVSTSFVESINGVSRTIFEVRMHQGFLPRQDQEPYVLGESARLERLSNIGMEVPRFGAEEFAAHQAGTQTALSEDLTANRP